MNAVFADTFYSIAMTNFQDIAHEKAKPSVLPRRREPSARPKKS